jgi:GDP-L-fucose synthase
MLMVLFEVGPEDMPHGMIIAPSEEHAIADIVRLIAEATGLPEERIRYDRSYGDGQHKKTADNALMRSLLTNTEFTPLKQGITETVRWFKENYATARK